MNKMFLLPLSLSLMMACTSQKKENGQKAQSTTVAADSVMSKATFADTTLTYPGSKVTFHVSLDGKTLKIQPSGLTVRNEPVTHNITGYTVTKAEIGDLNNDSYPEVFISLTYDGSGSYGQLIGYSVNNGKSMSQVALPDLKDTPELSKGYMGHDEMAIVESTFCRRFPIYKDGDTNGQPTGGTRQIQYKLIDGEACRILKVDKVTEF